MGSRSIFIAVLLFATSAQSLTLEEALKLADKQNLDLQVAQARLEQAQTASRKVWAAYLPQLDASGAYTRNSVEAKVNFPTGYTVRDLGAPTSNAGGILPGTPTNFTVVPVGFQETMVQPKDSWQGQVQLKQALIAPVLWPSIHNAYIGEDVAKLTTQNVRTQLLFGVARTYLGIVGLQEALKVRERLAEIGLAHEKDAKLRFDAGAVTRVTLLRAQQDRFQAEQDVLRAKNALESAKLALATLINTNADFIAERPESPQLPSDLKSMETHALEKRYDVLAAQRNIDLAHGMHNATIASYLPSLGFTGVYRKTNAAGFFGRTDVWALTLGVSWNIFDGGLREAQLSEAASRIVEAQASYQQMELRTQQEVRQGVLDVQSARANFEKAQERVALARESQRLIEASFKAGGATYLEVADANTALSTAEIGAVAEDLEVSLSILSLLKAAGVFPQLEVND